MVDRTLSKEETFNLMNELADLMMDFAVCKLGGITRGELILILTGSLYTTLYRCTCESAEDLDKLFMALSSEIVREYIAVRQL